MLMICPVMYEDAGMHKKAIVLATSSGSPVGAADGAKPSRRSLAKHAAGLLGGYGTVLLNHRKPNRLVVILQHAS